MFELKKICVPVVVALFVLSLSACGEKASPEKYLTEITWADTTSYMFAVEVDGFSGDIFQSGNYTFSAHVYTPDKLQAIYDVYTAENEYQKTSDVLTYGELIGTVGGVEQASFTADLNPGSYVYISYTKVLGDDPGNALDIALNK